MNSDRLSYLKKLVETHGGPGYEENVQALFRERVEGAAQRVETDLMGSVIAVCNDNGGPRVMIEGHSDEIAFVVRFVDDSGYLYLAASGGWDEEVLVGQRVLIHGANGPVSGVFGKKAIHLMEPEERKKKSELHQLWVDIGANTKEEALNAVEIGDSVTMDACFTPLLNGKAVAKSFDNRSGIFCVSETLRSLKNNLKCTVYGVAAVQEEIGLRGARAATHAVDPVVGIAIDVTHAMDIPDVSKKKYGDVKIGGGPVIVRGPNVNPKVFRRLVEVAKKKKIPYQVGASGVGTGTDANVIQISRDGVATGLIGIPLRYMHNPCELLALEDLENCVKLLTAFLESVSPKDDWTPGT